MTGAATVADQINKEFAKIGNGGVGDTAFADWEFVPPVDRKSVLERLGKLAKTNGWFKNRYISRRLAVVVDKSALKDDWSELALALQEIESWLYA